MTTERMAAMTQAEMRRNAATERAAIRAEDAARAAMREAGIARPTAITLARAEAALIAPGWDAGRRANRLLRDRAERCRRAWRAACRG